MATRSLFSSAEGATLGAPSPSWIHASSPAEMSGLEAHEFLRTCLSHRPEAARREAALSFVENGVDWKKVRREALRHGVGPLFASTLKRLLGDRLSSGLRDWIQKRLRKSRIHAAFLTRELGNVVRHCKEHNLPILALKGPVLAQIAYGDTAMRPYVDLDLLTTAERFSDLDRLLKGIGYAYPKSRAKITGWRRTMAHSLKGQWQFTRAGGAFNLDVHTRIMPPGYSLPADFEPFWSRAREIRLGEDVTVPCLATEDMVLALSYHGVKNQWRSLKYVVDLAELLRTEPALDWSVLIERARAVQSTRVLALALRLTQDLLDVSLPPEIQKWSRRNPLDEVIVMLNKHIQRRDPMETLSYPKRVRLQFTTKDTVVGKIRYGTYSTLRHLWTTFLKP